MSKKIYRKDMISAIIKDVDSLNRLNKPVITTDEYKRRVFDIIRSIPVITDRVTEWNEKEVMFLDGDDSPCVDALQSMRCTNCGRYHTTPYIYYIEEPNYCPFCGLPTKGKKR